MLSFISKLNFKTLMILSLHGELSSRRADDDNCCQWSGIMCNNQTGHVIGLDLIDGGLAGEVSHSLVNLSYLNSIDLSHNNFHRTIPTFIGSLTKLSYLDLGSNDFNGTIGNFTYLQTLYLGDAGRCRVENVEWVSHLSHLEDLNLDGISLAKANHWVDAISSIRKLRFLSLEGCELSHVMFPYSSSFLNSSSSSIEILSVGNNNLTSSMYPWMLPLTTNNLYDLDLSGNMLDGVPKYLGNLCGLEFLYFYNNSVVVNLPDFLNNLSGCVSLSLLVLYAQRSQFTGSLSDDIQKFSSLWVLDLSHNQLNGSTSEKLWELPSLETLDASFNNLTVPSTYHLSSPSYLQSILLRSCKVGPRFPKWIQTLKTLSALDLSNTGISDTIPLEFWHMMSSQLIYLNLSSNNISGKVPNLLLNFATNAVIDLSSNNFYGTIPEVSSTLQSLDLHENKFSGRISFLCQIVDGLLSFLDLSHNSLTGRLPHCPWRFEGLKVLNLGNNNLSGRLPPSIGSLIQLEVLHLYKNDFYGELPLSLKNCMSLISLNLGANKFTGACLDWGKLIGVVCSYLKTKQLLWNHPLTVMSISKSSNSRFINEQYSWNHPIMFE